MPIFSIRLKKLPPAIVLPLSGGLLGAFAVRGGLEQYQALTKPLLTPPPVVFIVAWSVLYLLMGVAAYRVSIAYVDAKQKTVALRWYYAQLLLNLIWPTLFFGFGLLKTAAVVLVLLWVAVLITLLHFLYIDKPAGYLLVPYLLWLSFAAYLNTGYILLNA